MHISYRLSNDGEPSLCLLPPQALSLLGWRSPLLHLLIKALSERCHSHAGRVLASAGGPCSPVRVCIYPAAQCHRRTSIKCRSCLSTGHLNRRLSPALASCSWLSSGCFDFAIFHSVWEQTIMEPLVFFLFVFLSTQYIFPQRSLDTTWVGPAHFAVHSLRLVLAMVGENS